MRPEVDRQIANESSQEESSIIFTHGVAQQGKDVISLKDWAKQIREVWVSLTCEGAGALNRRLRAFLEMPTVLPGHLFPVSDLDQSKSNAS